MKDEYSKCYRSSPNTNAIYEKCSEETRKENTDKIVRLHVAAQPKHRFPAMHRQHTYRSSAPPGTPLAGLPSFALSTKTPGSWLHI